MKEREDLELMRKAIRLNYEAFTQHPLSSLIKENLDFDKENIKKDEYLNEFIAKNIQTS